MTAATHCWRIALLIALTGTTSACMTLQAYEGPRQPTAELAIIKGDYRVRLGTPPVSLILRRVDERVLELSYSAVAVEPGEHELLVDCLVMEYQRETRHAININVDVGVYRLVPEMSPGNRGCATVRLDKVN